MSRWKKWDTKKAKNAVDKANETAIRMTLEVIREAANAQVPLDEGTLQNSSFVDFVDGTGVVSFGGGDGTGVPKVPYAIRWHEDTANFQRGRKNQYLRDPFNSLAGPTYRKAIAEQKL